MNSNNILAVVGSLLAAILIGLAAFAGAQVGSGGGLAETDVQTMGVSNFGSIHLADSGGTATPVFIADQTGAGVIAEYRDASTPVARFPDGGGLTIVSGGQTIDAGGLTVTAGGVAITAGQVDIGDWLNLSAQTAISLTAGGIITPTGTYQLLTSGAAVTTSTTTPIASGTETGDLLILRNGNASDVITIDGTGGTVECKANVGLGASDTLTLVWNGSDWNCLANYDNS